MDITKNSINKLYSDEEFDLIEKSHNLYEEGELELIEFYNLEKSKADLVPVQKVVTGHGKTFVQTFYVDPHKNDEVQKEKKNDGTKRLDSEKFKRGDQVKFKLKDGSEVTGEFRHIVVNKRHPEGFALINMQENGKVKPIGRKIEDIHHVDESKNNENKTFERRSSKDDFSVGDEVVFSIREKNEDGNLKTKEIQGLVTRFLEKRPTGQVIEVKDSTGKSYIRYTHGVIRYNDKNQVDLTTEEIVSLTKGINKLRNRNIEDHNKITLIGKKNSNHEKIDELNKSISDRNEKIILYLDVLKGKAKISDLTPLDHKEFNEIKKEEETTSTKTDHEEELEKVEAEKISDSEEIENARKKAAIRKIELEIVNAKKNITENSGKDDYKSKFEVYKAKKAFNIHMQELVDFKNANAEPLSEKETSWVNDPKEENPKPEKPQDTIEKPIDKVKLKTVTTLAKELKSKLLEEKQRRLERVEALAISEEAKRKIISKEKLHKEKQRSQDKSDIISDIERFASGKVKNQSLLKINQRISESKISEEDKKELRKKYAEAIRKVQNKSEGVLVKSDIVESFLNLL